MKNVYSRRLRRETLENMDTKRIICLFALVHCFGAVCTADRLVFCHYMMWAPLYNDTLEGFKGEVLLAQSYGIDAFALETMVWSSEYQTRAQNIYEAAKELGTGFRLFFSTDLDTGTSLSMADVQSMITTFQGHPNQLYYQGKQFLTTFAGQVQGLSFWTQVLQPFNGSIFFVPFFPTDGTESGVASVISQYSSILSGLFAWDTSAWPYVNGDYNTPSESNDQAYLAACKQAGITYMASVSPWFFTHTTNSNQVKGNYQGTGLWVTRWGQLVASSVQLVEIVSWNDWAERHYVTPVGSSWGPVEADWDDTGYPHQAFMELGSHYVQWFKSGAEPAVTRDELYMVYYKHSKNAVASNDPVGMVENAQYLDDKLYVTGKLRAGGYTIALQSGGTNQSFGNVGPGVVTVSMAFSEGLQQASLLDSNNVPVVSLTGALLISNQITTYDFNAYTAFNSA